MTGRTHCPTAAATVLLHILSLASSPADRHPLYLAPWKVHKESVPQVTGLQCCHPRCNSSSFPTNSSAATTAQWGIYHHPPRGGFSAAAPAVPQSSSLAPSQLTGLNTGHLLKNQILHHGQIRNISAKKSKPQKSPMLVIQALPAIAPHRPIPCGDRHSISVL